jgi:hypothetical protein
MGVYQLVEDLTPCLELAFLDREIPSKDTQSVMLDFLKRQLGPHTVESQPTLRVSTGIFDRSAHVLLVYVLLDVSSIPTIGDSNLLVEKLVAQHQANDERHFLATHRRGWVYP